MGASGPRRGAASWQWGAMLKITARLSTGSAYRHAMGHGSGLHWACFNFYALAILVLKLFNLSICLYVCSLLYGLLYLV